MTLHYFIAMNFELEREVKLKVNLTPEEIKEKYGDNLKPEVEGKLYDVLSNLFNNLVGIKKIIVPGEFKSFRGSKALGCSVKAAEGYLFPLKSSIVFIHKPVIYIRHSELKHVEFSRTVANVSRTFDLTLTKLKDEPSVTFLSIERDEHSILVQYFKTAGVKMKTVDTEGKSSELKDSPVKK
jgi:structure-specific recognition protein 1